jgi:hypothetical protein
MLLIEDVAENERMTEAEWLAGNDPQKMLEFLMETTTTRKLLLFAVSCCHRIWHLLTDARSRCLVKTVEQYADGLATIFDVSNASDIHANAASTYDFKAPWFAAMYATSPSHCQQSASEAAQAAACATWWGSIPEDDPIIGVLESSGRDTEAEAQCLLLRDIFGNPFRPVSINRAWLTLTVVQLAQAIYEHRRFEDVPVLADALEEAGCTDADILAHCRGPGPHVRGCWVVDLLTGRE